MIVLQVSGFFPQEGDIRPQAWPGGRISPPCGKNSPPGGEIRPLGAKFALWGRNSPPWGKNSPLGGEIRPLGAKFDWVIKSHTLGVWDLSQEKIPHKSKIPLKIPHKSILLQKKIPHMGGGIFFVVKLISVGFFL